MADRLRFDPETGRLVLAPTGARTFEAMPEGIAELEPGRPVGTTVQPVEESPEEVPPVRMPELIEPERVAAAPRQAPPTTITQAPAARDEVEEFQKRYDEALAADRRAAIRAAGLQDAVRLATMMGGRKTTLLPGTPYAGRAEEESKRAEATARLYQSLKERAGLKQETELAKAKAAEVKRLTEERAMTTKQLEDPASPASEMARTISQRRLERLGMPAEQLTGLIAGKSGSQLKIMFPDLDKAVDDELKSQKQLADIAAKKEKTAAKEAEKAGKRSLGIGWQPTEEFKAAPFDIPESTRTRFIKQDAAADASKQKITRLLGDLPLTEEKKIDWQKVATDPKIRGQLKGRLTDLMMSLKEAYDLGAITGPDMAILEGAVPNIADAKEVFKQFLAQNLDKAPFMQSATEQMRAAIESMASSIDIQARNLGFERKPRGAVKVEKPWGEARPGRIQALRPGNIWYWDVEREEFAQGKPGMNDDRMRIYEE